MTINEEIKEEMNQQVLDEEDIAKEVTIDSSEEKIEE